MKGYIMKKVLLFLLLAVMCAALCSCSIIDDLLGNNKVVGGDNIGDGGYTGMETYPVTITFDSNGGSYVSPITADAYGYITESRVPVPTRQGFEQGAFEPNCTRLTAGVAEELTDAARAIMDQFATNT